MPNRKKKLSRAEIAYQTLKQRIASGQISSGTMLSEVALAKELSMSRTPIREALKMLKSEGLVDIRDGIGTFVKEVSQQDIEDAYAVRVALECLAARTAVYSFTSEELDELEERFLSIQNRLLVGKPVSIEEFSNADWALHDQLLQKSQNRYAKSIIQDLSGILRSYQNLSVQTLLNAKTALDEHLAIIDCLRRQDLEHLIPLLERHIQY